VKGLRLHSTAGSIRVWTIQHADWWERLRCGRLLRGDGRRVWPEFRSAYRWLMQQMAKRVPDYGGGYPIWFWHSPKPDLRHRAHLPPGAYGVRIEAQLPVGRALLLGFDAWHCVLNHWRLSLTSREDSSWDKRTAQQNGPLPAALEEKLQATWERVFDLAALNRSPLWRPVRNIQAVAEYIRLGEIIHVDRFSAR
jgi:hypothetical protein